MPKRSTEMKDSKFEILKGHAKYHAITINKLIFSSTSCLCLDLSAIALAS